LTLKIILRILSKMKRLNVNSVFFFVATYISLIIGFYYGENSTGGAFIDYLNQKEISKKFASDFLGTLLTYDDNQHRHSPLISIYLALYEKIKLSDILIRFINLQIAPICAYLFYKTLKVKFKTVNNNYLFIFSLIFLISPTVRSLAIWPDSRLFGLTFFILSIYFYLLFLENRQFKFVLYNIFFLALSSYFSPNFSIFSLFFLVNYFVYYKLSKSLFYILIFNAILALPAIYYIFFLEINFLKIAAIAYKYPLQNLNIANKIILISTIFLFYFLPFVFTLNNFKSFLIELFRVKNIILSLTISLICIYFFSYDKSFYGGGIFFHISRELFDNNILLYLVSFFALLLILNISSWNKYNSLIFIILILNNPQLSIFHKYYDPLILILIIFLIEYKIDKDILFKPKNISIFYLFSSFFLIISLLK
tara:strand:+ start:47819 stop:49087 length:1269 start_codon:yes stop_codon:yes gene_type:complete